MAKKKHLSESMGLTWRLKSIFGPHPEVRQKKLRAIDSAVVDRSVMVVQYLFVYVSVKVT